MGTAERKLREKEQRRRMIVEAAELLFLSRGYSNTTMDEVAERCELSKGTLYLYFHNKDELYYHVLLSILDEYCDMLESRLAAGETYIERLMSLGSVFLDFHRKYPDRFRLMNEVDHPQIAEDVPPEKLTELLAKGGRIWEVVSRVIGEGIELGYFKTEVDPIEISVTVWATSLGLIRLMDHVRQYHHPRFECSECKTDILLSNLDFEKMIQSTWRAIFTQISTPKMGLAENQA